MANRAKSIPELASLATPATNDLLVVVDVSSANTTKRSTVASVIGNVANNDLVMANNVTLSANTLILRNTITPANSTALSIEGGTIFFDSNYLYIATSNNYIKRLPLSDF